MALLSKFVFFLAAGAVLPLVSSKACPPLGAVLPAPRFPSRSESVKEATQKLISGFNDELKQLLNASGVSVGVKSTHEDNLLFNYHFTPPVLSGIGTDTIDEKTIYRVGSLSKLFPALVVLQESINLDDSVLKYVPDLQNVTESPEGSIPWEDVTIGSLLSHLSGLATDMAQDLALFSEGPWTNMGLPPIPEGTGPNCSGLPGTKACTAQDFIQNINKRPPVYLPYTGPAYSNVAFALLGLVVEAVTGKPFEDAVQTSIYDVVGMNDTSFNGPVSSFSKRGFVPQGESTWNTTLGVFESAGGMFSSTIDLLAFAEGVLKNRFLSPRRTRQWLKPNTHTSSLSLSVGGPWEIFRSDNITADGRVVDVYAKTGDLGLYRGILAIVPDYDIAISILTGGPEVVADSYAPARILSSVAQAIIPAVEQAGREEASSPDGFIGTYGDEATKSEITLRMDSGPGLVVSSFNVRGFDVLDHATDYNLAALESGGDSGGSASIRMRLYPTNTANKQNGQGYGQGQTSAWRGAVDVLTDEQKTEAEKQLFYKDGSCQTWFELDRAAYNYLSLWQFDFVNGDDGKITAIKNAAFNVTMVKK